MSSRGVNRVTIIGNLGQDPEVKYMPSGGAVTNISVATSESWKDKQTGQQQDRVEWHRIVFFNKLAEIAGEYLKKGSQVYVEGSLRTRKWQDQSGQDRFTTEIVGKEMQMLGGSRADQESQPNNNGGYIQNCPPAGAHGQENAASAPPRMAPAPGGMDAFDDIPF